MNRNEKYAKLLALSILYEKSDPERMQLVQRVTCKPKDINSLLKYIEDVNFKNWVSSVSHLFKMKE